MGGVPWQMDLDWYKKEDWASPVEQPGKESKEYSSLASDQFLPPGSWPEFQWRKDCDLDMRAEINPFLDKMILVMGS